MFVLPKTPQEARLDLAQRFRDRRLALNLSQTGLATRSGVSLGSLKRFERTGQISLESLVNIALVLDCLPDFEKLAQPKPITDPTMTIDKILAADTPRKRGHKK